MNNAVVGSKSSLNTQIKSEFESVYVLEWSLEKGFLWGSDNQEEGILQLFASKDGISDAINAGFLYYEDTNVMTELVSAKDMHKVYLERILRFKMGSVEYVRKRVSVNNFFDGDGNCIRYVVTIADMESFVLNYESIQHRIEYDAITGIYNVDKFYEIVSKTINRNILLKYVIVRVDIDRFKVINDMYGLEEGNRLLIHMANIIKSYYKPGYIYCRVNSDIFGICMPYEQEQEIILLVKWLEEHIARYTLRHKIVPVFGVYQIEERNVPVSVMLDWAKLASKSVKGSLLSNYAFYNNALRSKVMQEIEIEGSMDKALLEKQFKLYFQPKYDIATSAIVGAEVLCRWMHPVKGFLTPESFIPLFERNGFIIQLDYYMWEETCKLIRKWLDEGKTVMTISLNVSRMHVYNSMFDEELIQLVDKYQIPPNLLELELTENVFLENENEIYRIMERLRDKGFMFSMDDFGSGYSSLNMLKSAPIDVVKLDKEFLNETSESNRGAEIIRYTIAMTRQLNLKVVAEGVETVEQAKFLLQTGCDTAQGFYYCKPVTVEEFQVLAFADLKERVPDVNIQTIASEKKLMLNELNQIRNNDSSKGFFDTSAVTYDEMEKIQNYYVKMLKKYRSVIFATNDLFYEFDLGNDQMIACYYDKGFEPERSLGTYGEYVDYLISNCHPDDKDLMKDSLSLRNLQGIMDEERDKLALHCRMKKDNKGYEWFRLTIVLVADDDGTLDNLLICSLDIDEA